MDTRKSPREIAETILHRSTCAVQVGSCLVSGGSVFSWGWNSAGPSGLGQCAEVHAILRANKKRLVGSTIYVAAIRSRNNKIVVSKPCKNCQKLIDKWNIRAVWRNSEGEWVYE